MVGLGMLVVLVVAVALGARVAMRNEEQRMQREYWELRALKKLAEQSGGTFAIVEEPVHGLRSLLRHGQPIRSGRVSVALAQSNESVTVRMNLRPSAENLAAMVDEVSRGIAI